MPTSASSQRRRSAEWDRAASDEQATVETFIFHVSPDEELAATSTATSPQDAISETHEPTLQSLTELTEQPVSDRTKKRRPSQGQAFRVPAPSAKKSSRWSSWVISLIGHGICVFAISLITITTVKKLPELEMAFSAAPQAPDALNLDQVSTETVGEMTDASAQLANVISEAEGGLEEGLIADAALTDFAGGLGDGPQGEGLPLSGMSGLADATGLIGLGGGGSGGSALGDGIPSGEKLTASFFGTKVDGERIMYVLDNSGGMQGGELELLIDELLVSVESLDPKQKFYVIFYSDMLYPLYYPHPAKDFVPATDRSKTRLRRWLDTVEFCMGNTVDQAIWAADEARPDVVYLLTDGQLDQTRDQRRMAALLDRRTREYPIHTFGFLAGGWGSKKAEEQLRQVAEGNKGTFRTIEVTNAAVARAKEKNRPYHDKEPGHEWGLSVGRSWGRK